MPRRKIAPSEDDRDAAGARVTASDALAELLGLLGEDARAARVARDGIGEDERAQLDAWLVECGLRTALSAIALGDHEQRTARGERPRIVLPGRLSIAASVLMPRQPRTARAKGRHGAPGRPALVGNLRHALALLESAGVEHLRAPRALALVLMLTELDVLAVLLRDAPPIGRPRRPRPLHHDGDRDGAQRGVDPTEDRSHDVGDVGALPAARREPRRRRRRGARPDAPRDPRARLDGAGEGPER